MQYSGTFTGNYLPGVHHGAADLDNAVDVADQSSGPGDENAADLGIVVGVLLDQNDTTALGPVLTTFFDFVNEAIFTRPSRIPWAC
ncbi:hypothetical protein EP51_42985 (plasmid) [Rhodococcus opacus]|uniref:Uncharacterized protein n=1 Tax=Rhodococcus opacus TaxID=37919 RepID=A0A076F0F2_RHOOP|nr:hypothetical protein EP51_42985 [Rhodococcus opacus]